jgi:peptidoglycan/xylan/chitin deacetylase (PgdA/CDA1 family)
MTFGIVRCDLVYFSSFGIFYQEKSGNPGTGMCLMTFNDGPH